MIKDSAQPRNEQEQCESTVARLQNLLEYLLKHLEIVDSSHISQYIQLLEEHMYQVLMWQKKVIRWEVSDRKRLKDSLQEAYSLYDQYIYQVEGFAHNLGIQITSIQESMSWHEYPQGSDTARIIDIQS